MLERSNGRNWGTLGRARKADGWATPPPLSTILLISRTARSHKQADPSLPHILPPILLLSTHPRPARPPAPSPAAILVVLLLVEHLPWMDLSSCSQRHGRASREVLPEAAAVPQQQGCHHLAQGRRQGPQVDQGGRPRLQGASLPFYCAALARRASQLTLAPSQTPREAIEGTYIDKKCPFTGLVSIRGRILTGKVVSTKMTRTIVIRREYLHFVPKYSRCTSLPPFLSQFESSRRSRAPAADPGPLTRADEKRHKNVSVHCSPAFRVEVGDTVTVGQCRPLSKTVRCVPSLLPRALLHAYRRLTMSSSTASTSSASRSRRSRRSRASKRSQDRRSVGSWGGGRRAVLDPCARALGVRRRRGAHERVRERALASQELVGVVERVVAARRRCCSPRRASLAPRRLGRASAVLDYSLRACHIRTQSNRRSHSACEASLGPAHTPRASLLRSSSSLRLDPLARPADRPSRHLQHPLGPCAAFPAP